MPSTWVGALLHNPDRLSVRELRDLAEPENFEFVEASGNRWETVAHFRSV
ncbi:MAG TPA: hypothetical protein VGI49_08260 [Mycobacterium sp.]|jgi:hypothetical protein